jgi:hypothetical protein
MCFSATASLGASALLTGSGIIAIKKMKAPKMIAFAAVPILFGLQQLSEGVLWLTYTQPSIASWQHLSIYSFLLFAKVIWPIWIPFSIWLMEPDKGKKKLLAYLMVLGGIGSIYLAFCLFAYDVSATIEERHINYQMQIPQLGLHRVLYLLGAAVPFFISSLKFMKLLGGALILSLVLSYIFYFKQLISVWCFFAALLSALVVFIVIYNGKTIRNSSQT